MGQLQNIWRYAWPRVTAFAGAVEDRAERRWRGHYAWDVALVAGIILAAYFWFVPPPAGRASLLVAVVAVVVSFPDMKYTRRWLFIALMFLFVYTESRSIDADNKEHQDDIAHILSSNRHKTRKILNDSRIRAAEILADSAGKFAATADRFTRLAQESEKVERLSKDNLLSVTGGDSYPYVVPQPIGDPQKAELAVWNVGNYPLTGVNIELVRFGDNGITNTINEEIGTISAHGFRRLRTELPISLNGNGIDDYMVAIGAQNGGYYGSLQFRRGPKGNWEWSGDETKLGMMMKGMGKQFRFPRNRHGMIYRIPWPEDGDKTLPRPHAGS